MTLSRRRFLGTTAGLAAGTLADRTTAAAAQPAAQEQTPRSEIALRVNGRHNRLTVEDRWTLAEVLRDHLGFTGTKIGCDRAQCGACTVSMDGTTLYACSYLAVWADRKAITTVEGLGEEGALDPLQQAFIEHDGPQCGFCTSGQLMSAKALLAKNPKPTRDDVRHALAGNLCRCSNYNRYVESVLAAAAGDPTESNHG